MIGCDIPTWYTIFSSIVFIVAGSMVGFAIGYMMADRDPYEEFEIRRNIDQIGKDDVLDDVV